MSLGMEAKRPIRPHGYTHEWHGFMWAKMCFFNCSASVDLLCYICYFSCAEAVTVNVKSAVPRKSKGTSTSSQKDSLCHLPTYQRESSELPCCAIPCTAHCLNNMLSWDFCMHVTRCLKSDICFPAQIFANKSQEILQVLEPHMIYSAFNGIESLLRANVRWAKTCLKSDNGDRYKREDITKVGDNSGLNPHLIAPPITPTPIQILGQDVGSFGQKFWLE